MKHKFSKGFTLIEMLTAVSIFAVVMTISVGSILSVFDTNRKSESLKTVMDNLNLALESIAREMRFGTNYTCNPSLPLTPATITSSSCPAGGSAVAFLANDRVTVIVYRINGTSIEKSTNGGTSFVAVTAPEIIISQMKFHVLGTSSGRQPKVLLNMKGKAGVKASVESDFVIQTLVSQRLLNYD